MNKKLTLLFKILFAFAALAIVYRKVDPKEIAGHLEHTKILYVLGSTVVLIAAQVISALRMRYYFIAAEIDVSRYFSIALYWVGMLFNTILPGGIGGDGYKIILMSKLEQLPKLTSLRLALSNRASGLFLLILLTLILAFFSHFIDNLPIADWLVMLHMPAMPWLTSRVLLWAMILLLFPCYLISIEWILKESFKTAMVAAKYSFIIQGCCLISAAILFYGMGLDFNNQQQVIDYLLIFMVSSVASILPVSLGGFGLREVTFTYGTAIMALDKELGVAFSLIYFAINTILSVFGIFFVHQLHDIHAEYKKQQTAS